MSARRAAAPVAVTVQPGHVLYVEGVAHGPGQTITVPASEAEQLEQDGTATPTK